MRTARTLLLAFLAFAAPLHAQPSDEEEGRALYGKLTEPRASALHSAADGHEHAGRSCATPELAGLQSFVRSRNVSDELRRKVSELTESEKPPLPLTLESRHFNVFYTDQGIDAVSPGPVQAVLPTLDRYYDQFKSFFGKIQSQQGEKITLEIYSFSRLTPLLQNALAFTNFGETVPIAASPGVFSSQCLAESTLAHELFHKVQFAHGLYRNGVVRPNDNYFIEGMAAWSTLWVDPQDSSFLGFANQLIAKPGAKSFVQRDYDAVLFWVYLDERFREFVKKRSGRGRIMDMLLDAFDKKAEKRAMLEVMSKGVAALVELEEEGNRPAIKASAVDRFFQQWHVANVLGSLGLKSKKLGYDDYTKPDRCGAARSFVTTDNEGGGNIASDTDSFSSGDKVLPAGAAHYYLFSVDSKVKKMRIKVTGKDASLFATVLGLGGGKLKVNRTEKGKKLDIKLNFRPGSVNLVQVVLGAELKGPGAGYALNINEVSLTGEWEDRFSANRRTMTEEKDGTVTGKFRGTMDEDGSFEKIEGKRVGNSFKMRFFDTGGDSNFSGSIDFTICGSGDTLVGIESTDGFVETFKSVWCRVTKDLPPFIIQGCDPDPTCPPGFFDD